MGALYRITSPSGKSYIGITELSAEERFDKHYYNRGKNFAIGRAFQKYGKELMAVETIFESDDWEALCFLETEFISGYKTKSPRGYNMTDGGEGIPSRDELQTQRMMEAANTPERKRRISVATKDRWCDPEYRQRHTASLRKVHDDPEWSRKRIAAVRKSLNERYNDPKNREKVSKQFTGERNPQCKLTAENVYEIRRMAAEYVPQKQIALLYGVDSSTVSLIHRRKNWKHLPEQPEGLIDYGY